MRVEMGAVGQASSHATKVHLDLPTSVGPEFLQAFDTVLLERTTSRWLAAHGRLLEYVDSQGDARVRHDWTCADGFRLGLWVASQRTFHNAGTLPADRASRLEALPGWSWDLYADQWDAYYAALQHFALREGHARVPAGHVETGLALGRWVINRRADFRKGRLDATRQGQLARLPSWTWHARGTSWERHYAALTRFAQREGHSRVPQSHIEDGVTLGRWVAQQRRYMSAGNLSNERAEKLARLPGWTWDPFSETWSRGLAALDQFVQREGHARVPPVHREAGVALGSWVLRRRAEFVNGALDADRAAALADRPGWTWDAIGDRWSRFMSALHQFVEREGHAAVPRDHIEAGLQLGAWVGERRSEYVNGKLSADKIDELGGVRGWSWELLADRWKSALAALHQFVKREGHALVPAEHIEGGVALGRWVIRQRARYAAGRLEAERAAMLEALPGWVWNTQENKWNRGLAALHHFVTREGHALVPAEHIEGGVKLGWWVQTQRQAQRAGRLSRKRAAKLESIPGWVWSVRDSREDASGCD